MSNKLAIIFPGIGYNKDKPLLYYSRKVLLKNEYEIIDVEYRGLNAENIFEPHNKLATKGIFANQVSKDRLMQFVKEAESVVKKQLDTIDYTKYDRICFISKSIGSVIGAIYAKQASIKPYHIMITPIEYALQFVDEKDASIFCGTEDPLVNYQNTKEICDEKRLDLYEFKSGNHSLETGSIGLDVDYVKKYVSIIGDILSDTNESTMNEDRRIYSFEIVDMNKIVRSMSDYAGKVLLIVNTATGCGYTPQYQVLEQLYKDYHSHGLEILDFPCNQFDHQAPGTEDEIHSFCTSRYGITFEQFAKIDVNGDKQTDLYAYLKEQKGFEGFDMSAPDSVYLAHKLEKINPEYALSSDIKWNFTKFLVNRQGHVIERFEPTTDMKQVEIAIRQAL